MLRPFMYKTPNGEEHSNQWSVCCLHFAYWQFSCSIGNHTLSSWKLNQVLVLHIDTLDLKWWHHFVSKFTGAMLKWVIGIWPDSDYYGRSTMLLYQNLCYFICKTTKEMMTKIVFSKYSTSVYSIVFCKWYNLTWTIGFCCCCLIGMYITMATSQLTRWPLNRRWCWTFFITEWHASGFLCDSRICLVDNNLIWNTQQVLFCKWYYM